MALSPDGAEVAVGGFTGSEANNIRIYFFDRASGRLTRHIPALPSTVNHLAYSADGRYLAAALGGANGIRVYNTADLTEAGRDSAYGGHSFWFDFDAQGRLVSSCFDGFIRLYDPQFRLLHKQSAPGGKEPFAVRFSPDGEKIAVGFYDSTAVNVLAADGLRLLYVPNNAGVDNGNLGVVAWSQDGQSLYAGGAYYDGTSNPLLSWQQAGRGAYSRTALTTDAIIGIQPLRDRRLLYGGADPVWGVLAGDGHKQTEKIARIVDYRYSQLLLNRNASALAFSFTRKLPNGQQQIVFDLNRQEYDASGAAVALSPAKTAATALSVTDWYDKMSPKLNRQPLKLDAYERSRSLAISADEQHFLLGADWSLRYYDRQGRQQWQVAIPDVAWAVNLSADGRFAVAAFSDGTIRWYRLQDGKEQLAFFPHIDGKRWVLWMPEGFYNASGPDAEALIGYHLNQGGDREGRFVEAKQLSEKFYRPDLIAQRLDSSEQGIQTALNEIGDVRQVLAQGLPPQLTLLSKADSHQTGSDYTLQFSADDLGGGIGKIVYTVNGSVLEGRSAGIGIPGHSPLNRRFTLPGGDNVIEAVAYNAKDEIASQPIKAVVHVEQAKLPVTLHVLALGISHYRDRALQLNYADRDALAMAAELKQRGSGLFDKVEVSPVLVNEQATLANIDAAFATLADKVRPQDVFVLYLAGHGKAVNGDYHFVPWEMVIKNDDSLREGSLDQNRLLILLGKIPALKTVVLLDTCDSGSFSLAALDTKRIARGIDQKTAITRLMRATGRAVLAATSDDNMALEGYDKHGVFTSVLLEGLKNSDTNNNAQIEIGELADFVENRVPEITKAKWGYEQFPMRDLQGMSFPIGMKP
ncbi:MAG: caspase family protein [Methylobacter sp.]